MSSCRVCYLLQGGYVFVVACLFVCLFCLLATLLKNFRTDLHAIFREDWQWPNEQMVRITVWIQGLFSNRLHTVSYDHIRLPLMNSVSIESAAYLDWTTTI